MDTAEITLPVFSDSHGRGERLISVLGRFGDGNKAPGTILFLGDGVRDFMAGAEAAIEAGVMRRDCRVLAVKGNCDGGFSPFAGPLFDLEGNEIPGERIEMIGGKRFFLTHGHRYGVKSELDSAIRRAIELSADVLVFGHTHIPYEATLTEFGGEELQKPLMIFNPGSLFEGSFGTVTIIKNTVLTAHGSY